MHTLTEERFSDQVFDLIADSDQHELYEFAGVKDRTYSDEELDFRDRGFLYGLAYGLVRGSNPSASDEEIKREAWYAAEDVWLRWNSSPTRRDLDRAALHEEPSA